MVAVEMVQQAQLKMLELLEQPIQVVAVVLENGLLLLVLVVQELLL